MGNAIKKQKKITKHEQALFRIKCVRDTIKVYRRRIGKVISDEHILTLSLLKSGQRDKAKSLLRKKLSLKRYLQNADGQLEILENLIYRVEASFLDQKVFEVIKLGSETLRNINEVLDIKDIENIIATTAEGIAKQKEVEEKIAFLKIEDDDIGLEDELKKIEQESKKTEETDQQLTVENTSKNSNTVRDSTEWMNKREDLAQVAGPSKVKKHSKSKKSSKEHQIKEKPLVIEM